MRRGRGATALTLWLLASGLSGLALAEETAREEPEVGAEEEGGAAAAEVTPRPTEWLPSKGRQCGRRHGRRVCDGPRMAPVPHGEAAELAERLGLGLRSTASTLLLGPPRPEWVEVVAEPRPEKLLWPVAEGVLWRGFGRTGRRRRGRLHKGVDIGAREGAPIRAVAPGLVAYSDNGSRGYGNLLMVVHADETVAFYAHCRALLVFAGQQVRAGQTIAEVGTTGITHGAHLHFELRVEGAPTDPLSLFDHIPPRPGRLVRASRTGRR